MAAWLEGNGPAPEAVTALSALDENLRTQDRAAQSLRNLRHVHGTLSLETIKAKPIFDGDQLCRLEVEFKNRATDITDDFMIEAVYPRAEVQKCIVHQIRNSLRYVSWKERKAMAKDLRRIYEAATEEEGSAGLAEFSEKWDKRYPHVSASWKSNWSEIATFYKFPPEVRALIYTTNPIESLHRKIKRVAKNKAIFPNDQALIKLVFLAVEEASKKWTFRHLDWAMIYSQLMIFFGDRLGKQV